MSNTFNLWGIKDIEEIWVDGKFFWKFAIRNPFKQDGGYNVGLNEKLLRQAIKRGVEAFILKIGEREVMMNPPNLKDIKNKTKKKEYEDRKSLFKGSEPMRIFYFTV